MYQSMNEQINYLKTASITKKIISDDIDQMVRNKLIQLGITPIVIEEFDPNVNRNIVMSILKQITFEPRRAFSKIYEMDDLENFSRYRNEFLKLLKGRTNLKANDLLIEWDYFKNNEMNKPLFRESTLEAREKYDRERKQAMDKLHEDQRMEIEETEELFREPIIIIEESERLKLKNDYDIYSKKLNELEKQKKEVIKELQKGIGTINLEEETKLFDLMKKLEDDRKIVNKKMSIMNEIDKLKKQIEAIQKGIQDKGNHKSNINERTRMRTYKEKIEKLLIEYKSMKSVLGEGSGKRSIKTQKNTKKRTRNLSNDKIIINNKRLYLYDYK